EVQEQIGFADVILLNKTDLVPAEEVDRLEARIRAMNDQATVHRTRNATVGMDQILDVRGFDLDRVTQLDPHFLEAGDGHHHEHPKHGEEVGSVGLTAAGDLDVDRFNEWLSELLQTRGPDIFRLKGVVSLKGQDRRYVFQGVHMQLDSGPDRPWGAEPRVNKLVFIGRKLDRKAITDGFRACLV